MRLLALLALVGLAGCAAFVAEDDLTWSREIARTMPLSQGGMVGGGAVVEVARFSRLRPGSEYMGGWEQFAIVKGQTPTRYQLVEQDGVVVIQADSAEGGSGFSRKIHVDPRTYPILEWRWRVPRDSGVGGARGPSSESPPARISIAFDGDPAKLDFDDRVKMRMAKALTVNGLPYASLLYVWLNRRPVEAIYSSPHTERVRHVVVESGERRLDEWIVVRRNIVDDYKRAFGEEPGDVVAVGIMTDYGDNNSPRRAYYGDISFLKEGGPMMMDCCKPGAR